MTRDIIILHVDDDPSFAEITATFLEEQNDRLNVETVASPEEGLQQLSSNEYHCVVSDYDMPRTDGIEFLHQIRDQWADLPFILFTGKGSEKVAGEAVSAGATDYLQKDSGAEQYELLANRIVNAVSQFRAEKRAQEERQRFQTLFDRLNQPAVELEYESGEPIIKHVNAAFQETFGYEADTLVGASLDAYVIPDDPAADAEVLNQPLQTGTESEAQNVTRQTTDGLREFLIQTAAYDDSLGGFVIYTDITDRKERQKKLKRSRELLGHTEELAGVGGWEVDTDTGALNWTRGTYAIHDVDPDGEFTPTVETALEFYHPDDRSAIETAIDNCRTDGEPYELELRVSTAEHEKKWTRSTGEPVYDGDDLVTLRGAVQDITAEKKREQELQLYEHLVEYSPELLVIIDEEMTVQYQSPPSPLLEWEPLDIAGEIPLKDIHPDDREKLMHHFTQLKQKPDRIFSVEFRAQDADGDWQWIESRGQNLTDHDAIDGILAVMREITHRKQQEQQLARYSTALEQLQSRTQALLGTSDITEAAECAVEGFETIVECDIAGVWLRDDDQPILTPVAISECGRELIPSPPTYRADMQSLSWETYQSQTSRYISDMSAYDQRVNKDTRIESEVIVPLGKYGIVNIGSTESDAFSDQIIDVIELWSDTLTAVFERLTQLELLRDREAELVRERDRLDEFTGIVSHDLRSPLSVATARVELADSECDSEHLIGAQQALARMEAIIDDSLELARQGKVVGETTDVELKPIITRCWDTTATAEATIEIEEVASIRADADRLPEIFENLFRNAVEHGGEDVTITVGEVDGGFYIEDDGPGIAEDSLDEVFEIGYSTSEDGTGFGLNIVKRIVEAHGWEIHPTEGTDGGARFEIIDVTSAE